MKQSRPRIQSLKLGAVAQILPIVAGYGTTLIATPYVVYRLGLHDFGVWSITGAIAQYAALFDMGVSRSMNRYVALFHSKGDRRSEGAVVGLGLLALSTLAILLAGLTYLAVGPVDQLLGTNDPGLALLLLQCAVAIMMVGLLARLFAAASVGRGRQVPAGVGVATLSVLQTLGGVIALIVRPSLAAFAVGTVVGTTVGFAVVMAVIAIDERRIVIGLPIPALSREILAYGLKSQVAAAGDILLMQSGKLIAGILLGPAAAGVYELASRLAIGAQVFGAASTGALIPHLTRCHIERGMDGVLIEYTGLTQKNTAVAIALPFAMGATAFSAIPLWLGRGDYEVIIVLLALLPGIAVNVSTGVCTSTLMAIGRPDVIAAVCVVAGVLQSILAVALGQAFGFAGIAAAFAVGVPTAKLLGLWYMQVRVQIPMSLYFKGVRGPYMIGVVAMSVAMPFSLIAAPDNRDAAVGPFLVSALIFCAVYASTSWKRGYLPRFAIPNRGRREQE